MLRVDVGVVELLPGSGRRGSGSVGYAAVGQDHAGAVGVDGSEAGDVAFADEEVLFGGLDGQHGLGIRRGGAGVPGGVERWGPGDLHVWLASSILYA